MACLGGTSLVFLVCLVYLACLVHRVGLAQQNKQDKPNKPNNGLLTRRDLIPSILNRPHGQSHGGEIDLAWRDRR
jgi:hypothetical protein